MSATIDTARDNPDATLKAKHRAMWALGDYATVAAEVIPNLGAVLVDACGVRAGQRVLDVAAGSGNAAIPAALTGADVVAADLTPELLEAGRRAAATHGAELEWHEADVEKLPYPDGEFDVVLSCVGVMFAPHHRGAADEMLRVCRPGGTIGLINWTPAGFVGQMFGVMKPYVAPPPPGAQPPPLWGDDAYLRDLFAGRVDDVTTRAQDTPVDRFAQPEEFRDYFKAHYGPTIAAYRGLAEQPERRSELDRELAELARRHGAGNGPMGWEYLLFTARKR